MELRVRNGKGTFERMLTKRNIVEEVGFCKQAKFGMGSQPHVLWFVV